ncbi:MAG: hypothetical protein ACLQUT_09865 [Thermoleophilia bacterium]
MRWFARSLAIVLAGCGVAITALLLVREVILTLDVRLSLPVLGWWHWLVDPGHSERALVAGSGCTLLAVLLLVLVILAVRRPARRPAQIDLAVDSTAASGPASIKSMALERQIDAGLKRTIADVQAVATSLRREGEGFAVLVVADVAAVNLVGVQQRVATFVASELKAATGMGLTHLDLEVRRLAGASL